MSHAGEGLSHGILKRGIVAYVVIVRSIDWNAMKAVVEFKDPPPGLRAAGRIWTMSGSGGTLYPPIKVGDLALAIVTGYDLGELLANRDPLRRLSNPFIGDKSDVVILPGLFAKAGEDAARLAPTPPAEGGWLLHCADGSELRQDPVSHEWIFKAAPGGKIFVGGRSNAKPAARDGDAVTAGAVVASQTSVYIGDP